MKFLKILIPVIFVYSIGNNFNFQGFMDQCRADGIVLSSFNFRDVNGAAESGGSSLSVELYEVDVATQTEGGKTVRARQVRLPGDLEDYREQIRLIKVANDA